MKKVNILHWVFTGLFGALMLSSAIPNMLSSSEWVTIITQLGYPTYILPLLGVAKFLGVVAILVPGFPRLKEWAYAGFTFDLIGATYSGIALGGFLRLWSPIVHLLSQEACAAASEGCYCISLQKGRSPKRYFH